MDLSICYHGFPGQYELLPRIRSNNWGIELQSYGTRGLKSEDAWQERLSLHKKAIEGFRGRLYMHGPFIGIEYGQADCLLRDATNKRMDMTFSAAVELGAKTVILHTGFASLAAAENPNRWLDGTTEFWQSEIKRYENKGIHVVLENTWERSPDSMIKLAQNIDSSHLSLCLDIGHWHVYSEIPAVEWISKMGLLLKHVHLHDNDGKSDQHLPIGQGTIEFAPIFSALRKCAPSAIISCEVQVEMVAKVNNFEETIKKFGLGE